MLKSMALNNNHPLSKKEFFDIYRKGPRLTVEIILLSDQGVFLTLRNIEPCISLWHLPGGTVRFGEKQTILAGCGRLTLVAWHDCLLCEVQSQVGNRVSGNSSFGALTQPNPIGGE